MQRDYLFLILAVNWIVGSWQGVQAERLTITGQDAGRYVLYLGASDDERLAFAATELQRYVEKMSGTRLQLASSLPSVGAILIGHEAAAELGVDLRAYTTNEEGFVKIIEPGRIVLAGNTPRATLYAVYSFLEDLGCRWYAPNFKFYGEAGGEYVPETATLGCEIGQFVEEPAFSYRSKRIEEGWSISRERLVLMIDWLAKSRHNVFNMTIDYGGTGRIPYERYRDAVVPELEKRGLLLHVGGHNYSLFLPDSYFDEHPDWFGMNPNGERVPMLHGRVNFNTANPEAVATFIENCKAWLRAHPEIDLFSLVPEDSPYWDVSPESRQLGSIPLRHALFANQVLRALKAEFPDLKVTLPAYQALIRPPEGIGFEDNAVLGFAVIRRDNTRPLLDVSSQKNLYYMNYLWQWIDSGAVTTGISLGGYYRRYAWRSLPVLNYSVIASDLRYGSLTGLKGIGEYGEPGDWFTFELVHYILARLSWNSFESLDGLLRDYCQHRFGPAAEEMRQLFFLLDGISSHIVRGFGDYSRLDSETPFPELQVQGIVSDPAQAYNRHLNLCRELVGRARSRVRSYPVLAERVERWGILMDYLSLELQAKAMTGVISGGAPYGNVLSRINAIYGQMQELVDGHQDQGLFLSEDNRLRYQSEPPSRQPGGAGTAGRPPRRER